MILSLGTNLGDRLENLKLAVKALDNLCKTKVVEISSVYETEPFGVLEKQENYYNCCLILETGLQLNTLLGAALGIESALGRKRSHKNASRIIDVDLIYAEGEAISTEDLVLPHPRALQRAFVLVPIYEMIGEKELLNFDFYGSLKNLDTSTVKPLCTLSLKEFIGEAQL